MIKKSTKKIIGAGFGETVYDSAATIGVIGALIGMIGGCIVGIILIIIGIFLLIKKKAIVTAQQKNYDKYNVDQESTVTQKPINYSLVGAICIGIGIIIIILSILNYYLTTHNKLYAAASGVGDIL